MEITPEVESLAHRPYRMIVWHDDENGWAAEIPDLPGLSAAGNTLEEMMAVVEEAKLLWIAAALAEGRAVPAPREELIPA
jgi:antitoxin HicB